MRTLHAPLACLLGLSLAGLLGCGRQGPADTQTYTDTYQSGEITIAAEESVRPLVEAEVAVFCSTYTRAKLNTRYVSEAEAVNLLLADSVRLIVIPRRLKPEEEAVLRGADIWPKYARVAYDALAVVTHPEHPVKRLTLAQLRQVVLGEVVTWNQLKAEGVRASRDTIKLVVDDPNGSTVRFLLDSLTGGKPLPPNVYSARGQASVIEYVKQTPSALGIIGLAWISDRDDKTAEQFRNDLHIVEVTRDPAAKWDYADLPNAYNLLQNHYPLRREIWVIHRDAHNGLGRGFETFFAGEQGQRVALKLDLLPEQSVTRVIDTSKRNAW
ncbi:MAG: substrate-binding domain-containing protein [Bacteroidia bacterium]|nr:substrate-binding domain-containing protein [Bacteroidia bacterium]